MQPWETLGRRTLLDRPPYLTVYSDDVKLPSGEVVRGYLRLATPDFVVIVPVRPDGRIGMIRSYKRGLEAVDLQPPSGVIEPGEDPFQAAHRELLEETGCRASDWQSLGRFVVMGNMRGGLVTIFLARNAERVQDPDSGDLEDQEVLWYQPRELYSQWRLGQLGQLSSTAALGLAFAQLALEQADGPA